MTLGLEVHNVLFSLLRLFTVDGSHVYRFIVKLNEVHSENFPLHGFNQMFDRFITEIISAMNIYNMRLFFIILLIYETAYLIILIENMAGLLRS